LNQVDPSRTTGLRRSFERDLKRRFKVIADAIVKAIVEEDVFGLLSMPALNVETPGFRRFAFSRDSRKVAAFMEWLNRQVQQEILSITNISQVGESIDSAWHNTYIADSYKRGVARARAQLRYAGVQVPSIETSGGINAVLTAPFHVDRMGVLFTRTFNELKGITGAMDQQISRVLADGMAEGAAPKTIARRLRQVITGIGRDLAITDSLGRFIPAVRRAQMLARTEIIRAHAQAQLQEFKNWGVIGVTVVAEFRTAGDDRVCSECSSYEGNTFSIEEASGIIPVHPMCRCIWIPKEVKR
jgi:SPP1 gp7 family putative phage head morphogenesis protein